MVSDEDLSGDEPVDDQVGDGRVARGRARSRLELPSDSDDASPQESVVGAAEPCESSSGDEYLPGHEGNEWVPAPKRKKRRVVGRLAAPEPQHGDNSTRGPPGQPVPGTSPGDPIPGTSQTAAGRRSRNDKSYRKDLIDFYERDSHSSDENSDTGRGENIKAARQRPRSPPDEYVQLAVTKLYEPVHTSTLLKGVLEMAAKAPAAAAMVLECMPEDKAVPVVETRIAHALCRSGEEPMANYSLREEESESVVISTPPEVLSAAQQLHDNLLPSKSKDKYMTAYENKFSKYFFFLANVMKTIVCNIGVPKPHVPVDTSCVTNVLSSLMAGERLWKDAHAQMSAQAAAHARDMADVRVAVKALRVPNAALHAEMDELMQRLKTYNEAMNAAYECRKSGERSLENAVEEVLKYAAAAYERNNSA